MTNTSPSLLSHDDAKQAARTTPTPLPPPQPGETLRKSARIKASKTIHDDDGSYMEPHRRHTAHTNLDMKIAEHVHTAPTASRTTPPSVVDVLGKHVTPPRPTKPPEHDALTTTLRGNSFGALGTNDDNDGSQNSEPSWESDYDPPPELQGGDQYSKAIVTMLKEHDQKAKATISSLRQYLNSEMARANNETLEAFQLERRQREIDLLSLREQNEKREATLLSIREEMTSDLAMTHRANKELSAKFELRFDKMAEHQSEFQAATNGTLTTIATSVSTITQSTSESVEAAVKGVTNLMVEHFGNIADTFARVEGDMAVLRGLVTSVRPIEVDAPTVPTNTGPTECSDDDGDTRSQQQDNLEDEHDPPDLFRGSAPLTLQERLNIQNVTRGPSPGFLSLQDRVHTNEKPPVRVNTPTEAGARAVPLTTPPIAVGGSPKLPTDPSGYFGSTLGVNDPTSPPMHGTKPPTSQTATAHEGAATPTHAPITDVQDFVGKGHFGSGYGRGDASKEAWAASARQRESPPGNGHGATTRMESHRPAGINPGDQDYMQDGPTRGQYQNSHGYDKASGYGGPHHHEEEFSGGCISSPRHVDRRRQALANKISPLDIEGLSDKQYHGGVIGYVPLDITLVHKCGYTEINSSDVIESYHTIIHVHDYVLEKWEDRYHNRGPQVDKILEKGLPTFPRLTSIDVESSVEFYDKFQKTSMIYLLALTPFDCISIKMGFEALCPPGMGLQRYATMARVLMEILPRLVPKTHTRVLSLITMVRGETGNGYDLLWRILSLSVPGIDPTIQVNMPTWLDGDIFEFAHSFALYYRLQSKRGVLSDDKTQSATFLHALHDPMFADVVTTLTTCIENYNSGVDDGYLPTNLCIMGLALQVYKHANARAQTVLPRARRTIGWHDDTDPDTQTEGAFQVMRFDGTGRDRPPPRDGRGGRPPTSHGRYPPRQEIQSGRDGYPPRPIVQGGRDSRRPMGEQRGRFARPDRNRGEYRPDIICDACRRPGHVAANCDVLAIALFIEKYKRDIPADVKDKIEADWIVRWKGSLGNPSRKPRRVMRAYIDLLDISIDNLDDAMCWECWPDDDEPDDFEENA